MLNVSMSDLVTAYRKAKVDLFYSSNPRRRDILVYEEDLQENLSELRYRVNNDNNAWFGSRDFVGGHTFAPKRIFDIPPSQSGVWSNPTLSWADRMQRSEKRAQAEFRLMSNCGLHMHVLSTLWMLQVGTFLDHSLSASSRGNRLRRGPDGGVNRLGSGSFLPYSSAYKKWRDDGISAMANALREGKVILAATADVTEFYHQLDPSFLLEADFISDVLGVELNDHQRDLNRLFVYALNSWAQFVVRETGLARGGIPVGLPASAVVANLALAELDEVMDRVDSLYYGRYVDDILLVVEAGDGLHQPRELWPWLMGRSGGTLTVSESPKDDRRGPSVRFSSVYLEKSRIIFDNSKNKSFHLSGASGISVIDSIRSTINERSSEWRSIGLLPEISGGMSQVVVGVLGAGGEAVTTLRDADVVSTRKHKLSLILRELALYERNLPAEQWADRRIDFYRTTSHYILSLPAFFDLSAHLPRLVSIAAASADVFSLEMLTTALARLIGDIEQTCEVSTGSSVGSTSNQPYDGRASRLSEFVLDRWTADILELVVDELTSAWSSRMRADDLDTILAPLRSLRGWDDEKRPRVQTMRRRYLEMMKRDLAYRPYRWTIFSQMELDDVAPAQVTGLPIDPALADGANLLVSELRARRGRTRRGLRLSGAENAGIVFATRPPTLMELSEQLPSRNLDMYGVAEQSVVSRILHSLRGQFRTPTISVRTLGDWPTVVEVPTHRYAHQLRIGLAMLGVSEADATLSALGNPNLTLKRLDNIRVLVDAAASHRGKPNYLVLPELALPSAWFPDLARGLRRSGISLIAGIEHQPTKDGGVENQVWAALQIDGPGLQYSLYRQDKQRPARPEKKLLDPLGLTLKPRQPWARPPVISHGDFRFAILICSEMTNIDYRAHLRGSLDALIVPEWNTDIHWFEALVESAALDLHAYVAQANTLGFGDTRLRAPMKDSFNRDVVRLRGGTHDYFVMGDMDIDWLRRFQTAEIDPSSSTGIGDPPDGKHLKPLPDGFRIHPARRRR